MENKKEALSGFFLCPIGSFFVLLCIKVHFSAPTLGKKKGARWFRVCGFRSLMFWNKTMKNKCKSKSLNHVN